MTYMDELQEGERCRVTDLFSGRVHDGVIVALRRAPGDPTSERVHVRYDDGLTVSVGVGFVSLIGDEDGAA